ncbi:hypothetical protein K8R47_01895 [archaeon]|nr:hypothetical protein [archaeon]
MSLQLNEPRVDYKEFYGANHKQMPNLIADGRVPMSVSGLMRKRLEVLTGGSEDVKSAWHDNYFDTGGDGIGYNTNGNAKIVLDSKLARDLNKKSKLRNGALVLPEGMYKSLEGPEFTRDDLGKYATSNVLTLDEVKSNPIWLALARGDQDLLNEYADMVFAQTKQRFGYDKNMGLWVSGKPKEPNMRLWCVSRLGCGSSASGDSYLDCSNGRLVGVAPEAHSSTEDKK